MGTARTEFKHRLALRSAHDAVGLGGDQGLVVDGKQQIGFNDLRFDRPCSDGEQRLSGKHGRALGNRPDVAFKGEVFEVVQKGFVKKVLFAQIGDIVFIKVQIFDVFHDLLQPCTNGKAAAVGHLTEENVKIHDLISHTAAEVAVGHGQLVEVAKQGEIAFLLGHDWLLT